MATPMTADEFRRWADRPENTGTRWELFRGVPAGMPAWPGTFHAVHMRVVGTLQDHVIRRGSGSVAFLGDGLITARGPDTVRRPAVMVFTGPPGDGFPPRFTTEVPDVVVDLVPVTEPQNRQLRRVTEYVAAGARLVWVVVPEDRCVIRYVPRRPPGVLDETEELTGNGVLPDFACRVADLFALPGHPPPAAPTA